MSVVTTKYAGPLPAVTGSIVSLANSATAAIYEMPPDWPGALVTFVTDTAALWVNFGKSGVSCDASKLSTSSASTVSGYGNTLAPNQATGLWIPASTFVTFAVPDWCTHFAIDASAASGNWQAYRSSGTPLGRAGLPLPLVGSVWNKAGAAPVPQPKLWLDASDYDTLTLSSTDVASWRNKAEGSAAAFSEGSTRPVWTAASSSQGTRATVAFTAGNSDKLVCTDTALASMFGAASSFTLFVAGYRASAAAVHSLFSVGTNGSNDGRWDFAVDASDDILITRVTSAGASTTSAYTTSINGFYLFSYTFDGSTSAYWQNRTTQTLTGNATGNVGTLSKISLGCRGYNTSTYDQYATAQIAEVMAFDSVLTSAQLTSMHNWFLRRYGV